MFLFATEKEHAIRKFGGRRKGQKMEKRTILCREANKACVEFVIRKYDSPMGVATYKTAADMPEKLRKALPD